MQRWHSCLWQTFSVVYLAPIHSFCLKTEPQFVQKVGRYSLTSGRVSSCCRIQERNPGCCELVMGISLPLTSKFSEDRYVAQFWLMRCDQRSDMKGVPHHTKSHTPALNEDAMLEVWHPSYNQEDKNQHYKNHRVERYVKSLLTLLHCCSLPGQPTSRLLVIWENQTPIYLGHLY